MFFWVPDLVMQQWSWVASKCKLQISKKWTRNHHGSQETWRNAAPAVEKVFEPFLWMFRLRTSSYPAFVHCRRSCRFGSLQVFLPLLQAACLKEVGWFRGLGTCNNQIFYVKSLSLIPDHGSLGTFQWIQKIQSNSLVTLCATLR